MSTAATTTRLEDVSVPLGEDFSEIRESVRRICADFPGAYWRGLEEREACLPPEARLFMITGFLGALIPE